MTLEKGEGCQNRDREKGDVVEMYCMREESLFHGKKIPHGIEIPCTHIIFKNDMCVCKGVLKESKI